MKKLHIGCGKRDFGKDWIHIDKADFPHIDSYDINLGVFDDNSVDIIYSAHMIEYMDRDEVKILLAKWFDVLKPSGVLRLAVPDFQAMASLYMDGDIELSKILGPLYGKMKIGDNETIYHRTVYDFKEIKKVLHESGFAEVRKYDWWKTEHSRFDDHSQAYLNGDKGCGTLISLNVQCYKPPVPGSVIENNSKAFQYRIGNIIGWRLGTGELIEGKCYRVDTDKLAISEADENGQGFIGIDGIVPIKLTVEHLKRFGFEIDFMNSLRSGGAPYQCYEKQIGEFERYCVLVHNNNEHPMEWYTGANAVMSYPKLRHVHELQNIYHAFTGKELT